ncbi:hypothetical protein COCVIDRAFT_114847 [Bipolaris victoriae FI3]|uniref:Uncharacterized protein n=1 Tax=Bipolaris victoriae (strain FI3) TaxID=930091 RepID=W7E539_BIPV3|nr:hypothetical protein COCVIDRAFT_114847 [Bipolaris victoriae FI3]
MAQNVRDWERSNQNVLCSLGYLFNQTIEMVKVSASQAAVVRCDGGMKLEIVIIEQKKAPSEGVGVKRQGEKQGTDDNKLTTEKGDQYKSTEIVHEDILLFNIALKGIESGYHDCFRSMPSDISSYRTLCATYGSLRVDVCKGRTLGEIIKDLKATQDYDEYRDKSKARDAVFELVYSILQDTFQSNNKYKNTIFNAVLFVVSYPGTFKWETRNAVRTVYESKFILSIKQRVNLDRWHELDFGKQASTDEDDVTTEEENLNLYDSDYFNYF